MCMRHTPTDSLHPAGPQVRPQASLNLRDGLKVWPRSPIEDAQQRRVMKVCAGGDCANAVRTDSLAKLQGETACNFGNGVGRRSFGPGGNEVARFRAGAPGHAPTVNRWDGVHA
jgi:hypothetical protein